ncbi:MAG: rhomboid family intramembrane serine protease [Treponema sp.]|jgi:membrane associated rhomboid family serine protease|nr:rhomboid family intramembrane serine protease [Treponema sp.]
MIFSNPYHRSSLGAVLVLIAINVLVFLAQQLIPETAFYTALNVVAVVRNGFFWQFLTYMFAHAGISHLFFNMLALFIFGTAVERRIGAGSFVLYYMICGILAGVFSFAVFWFTHSYYIFLVGASGAIFAVQLAFAVFFPTSIIYIWGILPLRAPVMVLIFTGIEVFSTITGFNRSVAHLTHLAGFGFGWIYILLWFKINPWKALTRR